MNIRVTGKNVDLTPLMEEYIQKKLSKLSRLYPKIVGCDVVVSHERYRWIVEANLEIKNSFLHAGAEKEDFREAVDEVKERITRQLKSFKDKRISLHHREAK
ncbi:MAG TPA: ribosome-associated translation inhibitor RaiA [bacterium]|nr:ribosome-associated translation inhibitor RaiA [bacterium]HEX67819.1 ribosome-associated translation inhibitor RaiA [bacterium]